MTVSPDIIQRLVTRDREAQGLPAQITDEDALDRVAAVLARTERDERKSAA